MAIPSSYTEESLKAFMLDAIGNMATVLEITADHFGEAVNSTLLAYGVDDIADATDIKKLRALAAVEAWRVAVKQASGRYTFSSASARYERKTIHDQAVAGLNEAKFEASAYIDSDYNVVGISFLDYADDPYALVEDDDE